MAWAWISAKPLWSWRTAWGRRSLPKVWRQKRKRCCCTEWAVIMRRDFSFPDRSLQRTSRQYCVPSRDCQRWTKGTGEKINFSKKMCTTGAELLKKHCGPEQSGPQVFSPGRELRNDHGNGDGFGDAAAGSGHCDGVGSGGNRRANLDSQRDAARAR